MNLLKLRKKSGTVKKTPDLDEIKEELSRENRKLRMASRFIKTISFLIVICSVRVIAVVTVFPVYRITGESMSPTLNDGDIVLSSENSRAGYGDMVVFYYGDKLLVKRCIAGPGDWIEIDEDGNVYINGVMKDEPYLSQKGLGQCDLSFPLQVPENNWFVMGDNREISQDSRLTEIGFVTKNQIARVIKARIWPYSEIKLY